MNIKEVSYGVPIGKGSGIYVLCSNKRVEKLNKYDRCGVLYIGRGKNISANRLRIKKNGEFDHCSLSYIVDFEKKKLRFFRYDKDGVKHQIKSGILKGAKPKLFYFYSKNIKDMEAELLIGHIMKYGQSPSLNSSSTKWAYEHKISNVDAWSKQTFHEYEAFENSLKKIKKQMN